MRTQRASPLPRFLQVDAAAGPLELLGLLPAECTPSRIEAALQRQLDRVGAHPEGDTPEADEVRLALHTAAAQLLDPEVRRLIVQERTAAGETPVVRGVDTVAVDVRASELPAAEPAPVRVATPVAVFRVEQPFGAREAGSPARKLAIIAGIAACLVVGMVIVLIVATPATTPPSPPTAATAPSPGGPPANGPAVPKKDGAVERAAGEPKAPSTGEGGRARTAFVEGSLIVKQLREASNKAKTDPPGGLEAFVKAVAPLADWWPKLEVGQRRAADDAVLEFLYVIAEKPQSKDAVEELVRRAAALVREASQLSADTVWPAAWATGMLTRLSVERGLPRSAGAAVAEGLNQALGAGRSAGTLSFEGGAEAALRRMPLRLVSPASADSLDAQLQRSSAEGVKRWAEAVELVAGEAVAVERLMTDGLEQILVEGPEPDTDQAVYEAVEVLATRIKWRAGGPARERLLEWFNDQRVSSADLRVLTGVLAGKSNAEGVDATMQLSLTATPDDRSQLRLRYAQAWGLAGTEARDKAFEQWRVWARSNPGPVSGEDDLAKIARLVVAVRVNLAARRLWLGDAPGCNRVLADLDKLPETIRDIGTGPGPAPMPMPPPSAPTPPARGPGGRQAAPAAAAPAFGGDGPWAEAYLKAERNIPVRLQRLQEAESLAVPLARVDAAVLVEAACFASPAQVRAAAQRVVMRFGDDPSIVQACLDELPLAPKVQSVSEMLARVSKTALPKVGDPDWELAARRALVERALGLLAGQGPQAGIDQGCSLIAESYIAMSGTDSGPADEGPAERCMRGAGQLFKLWRLEAERLPSPERPPLTLEQIDRRHRSRSQIASGPVQAFSGEEVSVAETLAYIVCAERPVQAARVRTIIETMARERRESDHVFDQMAATERAITRLWLVRFGEVGQ